MAEDVVVRHLDDGRVLLVVPAVMSVQTGAALLTADRALRGDGGRLPRGLREVAGRLLHSGSGSDPVAAGRCVAAGALVALLERGAFADMSEVEAGRVLGVSPRRVRQLVKNGLLTRSAPGRVLEADVEALRAARARGV